MSNDTIDHKSSKKKKKASSEELLDGSEEQLDDTISKAQDMDGKLSGLTGNKKAEPELSLPPSTAVFLNQPADNAEVTQSTRETIDPDREKRIVEKNTTVEKSSEKRTSDHTEPDDDLIEDHKDFERKPMDGKRAGLPVKTPQKPVNNEQPSRPAGTRTPQPAAKRDSTLSISSVKKGQIDPRQTRGRPPGTNVYTPTKFEPAVAGVADTNLKKCPQCGGFVNLAVSKSCFSCGYDIK